MTAEILDPTLPSGSDGRSPVERLVKPRSVAIVGLSSKPGSAGQVILSNLGVSGYRGNIHLVGRSGGTVDGHPVLPSVDDLPDGVDLAVLTVPAAGAAEALAGCARRGVGGAVVFASGFAEIGEHAAQDELAAAARRGNIALLGPNCLGFTNALDGLRINFAGAGKLPAIDITRDPPIAIISQSGGLMAHIRAGLDARDLPVPYAVSLGNEAGVGLADFVDFFAADPITRAIIVYVEQVRRPAEFLAAAGRAREAGKPLMMLHPGRGERARTALLSHTGSLAGDYAMIRTLVTRAGVALIETLDELLDTAEILARFPVPPVKGPGILTFSGAFCAIAHDFCDDLGLALPALSADTVTALKRDLPPFALPANPLDLTTQPVFQPDLIRSGAAALLADENIGSLVVSIAIGSPKLGLQFTEGLIKAAAGSTKPVVFSILGDRAPLPPDLAALARENRLILSSSVDRSLRAIARATAFGQARGPAGQQSPPSLDNLPQLGRGPQPEWLGKRVLAAAGIAVPAGDLASNVEDAVRIADRIGFPVVLKGQAATLAHKTEAGAVMLGISDADGLRDAWTRLAANVAAAQPGLVLEGVLVERMVPKGLELMIGARRDPAWGPVLLVGFGGVWVEALGDARLLPPDLQEEEIVREVGKLRMARLLRGFRGSAPADIAAIARAVMAVGAIMAMNPEIAEIDVNPLFVHAEDHGVTAADVLIVTAT